MTNVWDKLNNMHPVHVAAFLGNEHAQLLALVFTRMDRTASAKVLECLIPDARCQIIHRMLCMNVLPPGAIEDIEDAILSELNEMAVPYTDNNNHIIGVDATIPILEQMSPELQQEVFLFLKEEDNSLAEKLEKNLVNIKR